jgi:hypothetical protein
MERRSDVEEEVEGEAEAATSAPRGAPPDDVSTTHLDLARYISFLLPESVQSLAVARWSAVEREADAEKIS